LKKQLLFKILTVGDGYVGKTTLLRRYVEGLFYEAHNITIGVDFFLKQLIFDSFEISLQLWDFGGQEQFRFILKKYIGGAAGALLLCDLSDPSTIDSVEEWVNLVRSNDNNLPIILVGTKLDLVNLDSIDDEIAFNNMVKFRMSAYIKISSKTGTNIDDLFNLLVKQILRRNKSKLMSNISI